MFYSNGFIAIFFGATDAGSDYTFVTGFGALVTGLLGTTTCDADAATCSKGLFVIFGAGARLAGAP